MSTPVTLTFLGGAGTVTGSKFLLTGGDRRVLVDAGLFQGLKRLRLRNRAPFAVDPALLDDVLLTHAHADHTAYLPALVKHGMSAPVHATRPTLELADIVLRDAAHLQMLATGDAILCSSVSLAVLAEAIERAAAELVALMGLPDEQGR